jgi:hypothetical protein
MGRIGPAKGPAGPRSKSEELLLICSTKRSDELMPLDSWLAQGAGSEGAIPGHFNNMVTAVGNFSTIDDLRGNVVSKGAEKSERIARGRVLCYKVVMTKRLTLTMCMLAALFVSAVRLPASSCPVLSAPIGQACKPGSCPNKACCADAEKNKSLPSPPLAKNDSASQQLVAIVAPSLATCLIPVQAVERPTDLSRHVAACATPKRVFLCTFLI